MNRRLGTGEGISIAGVWAAIAAVTIASLPFRRDDLPTRRASGRRGRWCRRHHTNPQPQEGTRNSRETMTPGHLRRIAQ